MCQCEHRVVQPAMVQENLKLMRAAVHTEIHQGQSCSSPVPNDSSPQMEQRSASIRLPKNFQPVGVCGAGGVQGGAGVGRQAHTTRRIKAPTVKSCKPAGATWRASRDTCCRQALGTASLASSEQWRAPRRRAGSSSPPHGPGRRWWAWSEPRPAGVGAAEGRVDTRRDSAQGMQPMWHTQCQRLKDTYPHTQRGTTCHLTPCCRYPATP